MSMSKLKVTNEAQNPKILGIKSFVIDLTFDF
jgi:hypothetical protein